MTYQLMKTTPYLGGQVRIDLVSDRIGGDSTLVLDEVNVVPLSDRIWYSPQENQINNRHSDNIVELYKGTQENFYKCLGDINLETKYPYYTGDVVEDTVDHTYQMGLRRISRAKYDKELSFLLPMWIDSQEDAENLEFFVHVDATFPNSNEITSKKFTISDRLRKYISDYFEGVSSDLMYIGLRDQISYITGLDVTSGAVLTKDVSQVIQNLTERERPLLETDNILVRKFSESKMVARQLVNFNLIFSINDLFEATIEQTMHWSQLNIWCEAKLKTTDGYKDIPLKDLYTNYTDIYSYKISDNPLVSGKFVEKYTDSEGIEHEFNVLDYLQDYKNIDMIHSNRILQPNFHWAFRDNERYTWNLYNGFSPLVDNDGEISRVAGRFFGTPDIFTSEYSVNANNIQWINVLNGMDSYVPGSFIGVNMLPGGSSKFVPNKYGSCWEKGIKYNIGDILTAGVQYIDPETGDTETLSSNGMYSRIAVILDIMADSLSKDRVYCAVLRKSFEENGASQFKDFVYMVYVIEDGQDIRDYPYLDNMTFQGVRSLLSGNIVRASEDEVEDVFRLLEDDMSPGEFYDLFVCLDNGVEPESSTETESLVTVKSRAIVQLFSNVLGSVEYPNIVRFTKSVGFVPAAAPAIDHLIEDGLISTAMDVQYASEIEYEKIDDDFISYLYRYDGNIIPQFIEPELPETEEEGYWSAVDSGPFNTTWRKTLFNELTPSEVECMNYMAKQRTYKPNYPSIGFYYEKEKQVRLGEPNLPVSVDGREYLGELCWFRNNKVYYTDTNFSLSIECTADEMNEQTVKRMFIDYVSQMGVFRHLENAEEVIEQYLWNRYKYQCDWEYAQPDNIDLYVFKVIFSLK